MKPLDSVSAHMVKSMINTEDSASVRKVWSLTPNRSDVFALEDRSLISDRTAVCVPFLDRSTMLIIDSVCVRVTRFSIRKRMPVCVQTAGITSLAFREKTTSAIASVCANVTVARNYS
jgi:hypothetical protein